MQFNLISAKGTRQFSGTVREALDAAIAMDEELQPAFGVTMEMEGSALAEVSDGKADGKTPEDWWAGYINSRAIDVCGCAWDDAPDFATSTERLEWIRDHGRGQGTDGEITLDEINALIDEIEGY